MEQQYRLWGMLASIGIIVGIILAFAKYELLGFIILACSIICLYSIVLFSRSRYYKKLESIGPK